MQERGIDIRRLSPEAIDNIMSRYEERIEQQAARIKELEAEVEAKNKQIKELQDIIDKPPEEAQWMTDYHLLRSAMDDTIIESARRWHGAFRKAQNSNLIRLQQNARLGAEVERLRAALAHELDLRNRHIESLEARIKELEAEVEAKNKQIKELQDLIDKPPEEADWVADYHLLQSALDGPIIDAARKWHAAYRKAQNSNLMRAKEVERLRSREAAPQRMSQ